MEREQQRKAYPIMNLAKDVEPAPLIEETVTTVLDVTTTVTYVGFADLKVKQDEEKWEIHRITQVSNSTTGVTTTKTEYPHSTKRYQFKWSERASYSYSR